MRDPWLDDYYMNPLSSLGVVAGVGCLPCVGATANEVLTAPDCGAAEVTARVLAALGFASKDEFAKKVGLPASDPQVCIALALAGQYKDQGMSVADAVAKAKANAPAELKKFLGDTAPPSKPMTLPFGLQPMDLVYAGLGVAAALGVAKGFKVI